MAELDSAIYWQKFKKSIFFIKKRVISYSFLVILLCASWPRGHLLFFASPKQSKQKKGDPGCRFGYAKLPFTAHVFGGGR
jgi:hypothetical protein